MHNNSNFDTKGFVFFMKSVFSAVFLFMLIVFVPGIYTNYVISSEYNTLQMEARVSSLHEKNDQNLITKHEEEKIDSNKTKLGFVGDIMLDRNIESVIVKSIQRDFQFPFYFVDKKLKEFDILFGNLEGPVSDKGADQGSIYSFRMDPKVIDVLKSKGFKVLSVANNHMGDWGTSAMKDTFVRLDNRGIKYVGGGVNEDEAYNYKIIEIKGIKIAYAAFSQFGKGYLEAIGDNSGIAIISKEKIKDVVKRAQDVADIVVVSFHFGDEYQTTQNKYQEKISRYTIDQGADLVVGHHPHVVQPIEEYEDGYIAYSLGNFIFDQNFSDDTKNGAILEVTLKENKIIEVKKTKVEFTDAFQPFLVE